MGSKKPRGFAWLKLYNPEKLKLIASTGGSVSQATGKGRRWTEAEARAWGQQGGRRRWALKKGAA